MKRKQSSKTRQVTAKASIIIAIATLDFILARGASHRMTKRVTEARTLLALELYGVK